MTDTSALNLSGAARVVGVDFGERRVGIAIADPLGIAASPFGTFNPREAIDCIGDLHESHGVERIVIGWPLELDGSEGEITEKVRAFIELIRKRLPGVKIVAWDERFTSRQAERTVHSSAKRRDRRNKEAVDRVAAALILQSYLDADPRTRSDQDRLVRQRNENGNQTV